MAKHFGSADYVIVGAGSAGCVLASRLSDDPRNMVVLLEAGGSDNSPLIRAPGGLLPIMMRGMYAWKYQTAPQAHLDGRVLYSPRGKVLGGSSSINGMVYDRGTASDYDGWAAAGNSGWSFADVLPYFKRAENYQPHIDQLHGALGPVQVSRPGVKHPLSKAWIEAGAAMGLPYNDDTNGATREGFGPVDLTVGAGRRSSSASAYLSPAVRRRPNLEIFTNAHATRILFDGARASGVAYMRDGKADEISALREVIVCTGALNSPQLLMLSGIGDGDHLREHGIAAKVDLKGVGHNLQDHLAGAVRFACSVPISLYNYMSPVRGALALGRYIFTRTGPLASSGLETVAYVKSHDGLAEPDLKLLFALALYQNNGREFIRRHGFFAHINVVRPASRGRISLGSADPMAPPVIDPNFLAVESDLVGLRKGIQVAREIFGQKAFDPYRDEEIAPGPSVKSDAEIDDFIRARAEADYHSVGTCKMGDDDMAVVDSRLKVHGVEGLRVVDASVMPTMVGGNTNMPVIMIAEKAADLIREGILMPTQSEMKAALQAYIDGFNAGDADAIMALFADNAVIEDPVGSPLKSRAAFEAFIRDGVRFGARLSLAAPIRGSHGNQAAMAFVVTFVQDGMRYTTNSMDAMTFNEAGKITRMNGYWGPSDVTVG